MCQAVCLSCMMHQVHAGICHTGSAELHSPHYPLWTRTDVISLSVSLSLSSSLPFFYLPLSHSCIIYLSSRFLPFRLPESIFVLAVPHPSPSLFPLFPPAASRSLPAGGLISLVCRRCCWVTEHACHAWFGGLG